jgi:hypothetical protein
VTVFKAETVQTRGKGSSRSDKKDSFREGPNRYMATLDLRRNCTVALQLHIPVI